jgi:hypothetical protein
MKKLPCIFILLLTLSAHSQNPIPNPGFETWVDYGPYEDPQGWSSLNEFTWPFNGVTVKKDSATQSGVLSVKLITIGQNNTSIPGVLCTGTLTFSNSSCSGGFPVSLPAATFEGFYKYLPETGDSCLMFAMLTKWNTAISKRDTVAVVSFNAVPVSNYTFFSKPFNYNSSEIPDSGQVYLSSTINLLASIPGSVLVVDDLSFSGIVGMMRSLPRRKIFLTLLMNFYNYKFLLHFMRSIEVFDYLGGKIKVLASSLHWN